MGKLMDLVAAQSKANGKMVQSGKITYINGVNISTLKKIAVYEFGAAVVAVQVNAEVTGIEVILSNDFEDWQIKKFTSFWLVDIKVAKSKTNK